MLVCKWSKIRKINVNFSLTDTAWDFLVLGFFIKSQIYQFGPYSDRYYNGFLFINLWQRYYQVFNVPYKNYMHINAFCIDYNFFHCSLNPVWHGAIIQISLRTSLEKKILLKMWNHIPRKVCLMKINSKKSHAAEFLKGMQFFDQF